MEYKTNNFFIKISAVRLQSDSTLQLIFGYLPKLSICYLGYTKMGYQLVDGLLGPQLLYSLSP